MLIFAFVNFRTLEWIIKDLAWSWRVVHWREINKSDESVLPFHRSRCLSHRHTHTRTHTHTHTHTHFYFKFNWYFIIFLKAKRKKYVHRQRCLRNVRDLRQNLCKLNGVAYEYITSLFFTRSVSWSWVGRLNRNRNRDKRKNQGRIHDQWRPGRGVRSGRPPWRRTVNGIRL